MNHSLARDVEDKMAANVKWRVAVFCFVALALRVDKTAASSEVMKKLTLGFVKVLDTCKKELNLEDHVMQDFYNFWKEDYDLVNRDVGCAIMCMASKFDLVSEDLKLHHGNAQDFAKSHGADDETAKQLVMMIHDCENANTENKDDCLKTLEVAKCFRTKIHGLKWAPDMETVLEEIIAEVRT